MQKSSNILNIGFKGEEIGHILANFKAFIHKKPTFNEKKLLQDMKVKIHSFTAKDSVDKVCTISITLELSSVEELQKIIKQIIHL